VKLPQFLSEALRRPFRRGDHDCMTFAADWAVVVTGQDPAASWRGAYSDAAGAARILEQHGGARAMVGAQLEAQGWRRVADPAAGDIALINAPTPTGHELVAAVCVAGAKPGRAARFALVTQRGIVVAPADCIEGWRHD
jgi:hypothetical protein